ncbi:MAG TPA: sigma-70 family RNA polymerase sigma factor [Acidobacteriaceae bacterium]|nr:sigma-70 family RNA polymerase sigma factor [Acidobacteriaceae bacterium]
MNAQPAAAASGASQEAQRIASILAGNTQEFHDLVRPYERGAYVMALSMLKNEADAEEVAQEALLKAFRNLRSFRAESKFSTWLMSIVLNEARNRLRRKNTIKIESLDVSPGGQENTAPTLLRDWREIPSETLERMEVRQMLQRAIAGLPEIYREVLVLRDVEDLSVIEAAEALGITISSVKVRLHRARMMMQKVLAPQLKQLNPKRRWLSWL